MVFPLQTLEMANPSSFHCPIPLPEPQPWTALHRRASARTIA